VTALGAGQFRVRATLTNDGFLPTSLTGRGAVGQETGSGLVRDPVVRPPALSLGLQGAELIEGSGRVQLLHLRGTGPFLTDIGTPSETVEWIVQVQEGTAYVQVTGRSDKAGVVRSVWVELR
jgi:hypothetical protein